MRPARRLLALAALLLLLTGCGPAADHVVAVGAPVPEAPGCPLFPADSHWNTPVDGLPVHPRSADVVAAIGLDAPLHPDFGAGLYEGSPIGIPYTVADATTPRVAVTFGYAEESDPGPYPIPADAPIEGGPDSTGDRHVLVVEADECRLYELYDAHPQADGSWTAGSGAVWDLASHALRPAGWTSADAAGLPILPGLVRYDEVAAGRIDHALRITAPETDTSYVWPARHQAGARDDDRLPPMGLRLRLRADLDVTAFPEPVRVILRALQTYGAIVADNGSPWFLSGVPDDRWDNEVLRALRQVTGASWEAVDTSSLIVDPDSGQAATTGTPPPAGGRETGRLAGPTRIATAGAISQAQFPDGAEVVHLARADDFPDALAGGTLTDGPILLVPSCGPLPPEVAAEIARLDPDRVLALGGPAAVCDAVLAEAAAVR